MVLKYSTPNTSNGIHFIGIASNFVASILREEDIFPESIFFYLGISCKGNLYVSSHFLWFKWAWPQPYILEVGM
jgi:hypothetical protein